MKPSTKQRRILAGCIALTLGGLVGVVSLRPKEVGIREWLGQTIPAQGLVIHPQSVNPGDPENAVTDFRRIYAAIDAFRRENGRLPRGEELLNFSRPLAGGIQLTKDDFYTPDRKYSERYVPEMDNYDYGFALLTKRPDGRPKPAFPPLGEKDVWMTCEDYTRAHQKAFRDGHSEFRPEGVHVVLWSDGTIEKIPNGKGIEYLENPSNPNSPRIHSFAGQAGLPKDVKTTEEWQKRDTFNKVVSR